MDLPNQTDRILSEIANWSDSEFRSTFGFDRHPDLVERTYQFVFDESIRYWEKSPGYNQTFLAAQEQWANHRLQARGHLFLNEVLDILGIERLMEGQISGWITTAASKNQVDFGIPPHSEFARGYKRDVTLKFTVLENVHYYI